MSTIGLDILNDRKIGLRFEQFPEIAHAKLLERIAALTAQLEARVKAAEPVRTGRLRAQTASFVVDRPNRIAGVVKINAGSGAAAKAAYGKAAALEYGASGTTRVAAHMMRLDHFWSKLVSPREVMVAMHSRRLDIPEHGFLRGSLASMQPEVQPALRQALQEAEAGSAG